jgi:LysM repeat protein
MARRDVIIISVLVNAALLVILFISAISSNDEKKFEKSLSKEEILKDDIKEDLFSLNEEEIKEPIVNIEEKKDETFLAIDEKKENIIEEEKIMHKLPITTNVEEIKKVKEILNTNSLDILVQKGDSLDKIARKHNVKISEIVKLNNLSSSFLKVGQKLSIPSAIKSENITKIKEEKKTIEKPIEKIIKEEKNKIDPEFYTVKTGDNPYTIAMKHNIKLSTLLKLNELNEKKARKLKPGDKLRIR